MLIRLAYDIQFDIPASVAMMALLNVHPSRARDLLEPDELQAGRHRPTEKSIHLIAGVLQIR